MSDTEATGYILSIHTKNTPGVLLRVSGLSNRRYYSIINIVAAQTEGGQYSETIIVVQGGDRIVRRVDEQLSKLEGIEQATVLERDSAMVREHLLLCVRRASENNEFLVTPANMFHASVLQVSPTTMILELVGDATAPNNLVELYKPYRIKQIFRTGAMAMSTRRTEAY